MSANTAESAAAQHLEYLASAPPFIFLLIAAADGKVERKEVKRFSEVLQQEEFVILAAVMAQAGITMEKLLAVAQERLQDPMTELVTLSQIIDARLPGDAAAQFRAALINLGHAVAQVSAGMFSRLRGKLGKSEAAMLTVIAGVLGSGGAASETPQPGFSSPEEVLTDDLFPALKPADWVEKARGHVAMQSVFGDGDISAEGPAVGFVHDMPQTVQFVPADVIGEALSMESLHARAMQNLERRLADAAEWHELSFDTGVEGLDPIDGLVLIGDFFASEGILSESKLKEAHQRMDSALLMAIVPQRGELFVTNLVDEEDPAPEPILFAEFAIKKFFNPEQAPISPSVFIIRNGKIVGNIAGMEGIIERARSAAQAERQEEESLLQHNASLTGSDEVVALRIDVEARCLETMNKNLQHVIRAYAQRVVEDARFAGSIEIAVTVKDPAYTADQRERVSADLESMSHFLTEQFAAIQLKTDSGAPITLDCRIEEAAAA